MGLCAPGGDGARARRVGRSGMKPLPHPPLHPVRLGRRTTWGLAHFFEQLLTWCVY